MSGSSENKPIDLNFENLFKTINFTLRANLSHPNIVRDLRWLCKFGVLYGIFLSVFFLLVYSIYFHDLKNGDSTQACANGILCVVFIVVTFNYCIMFTYKNVFKELIDKMNIDYQLAKNYLKKEQKVVLQFAQKGQGVAKFWLIVGICAGSLFVVKQVFLTIYYTATCEFRFIHLYELTYPNVIEEVKNNLIVYCILYIYFLFYDIFATIMFIGFAPMGSIFMLHACGQLELAKNRVLAIFNKNNSSDEINKKLRDVAEFLNTTYRFIDSIQFSFKVLYELTLKSTTIVVPITLYQVLESFKKGEFRVEFITIIIGGITLSSIPCYYSDALQEAGQNLRMAVYVSGWETHWERKSRTMILMLLLRTSRPVAIRTMFRDVCLGALTDVYHQAYAIFNVLNAAWN
ncbi:uncharacterized protein LOC123867705 [Maniola jurtina]|uniref:uncharacterized protein LOC123867705 n=1 Tax=Maniola jurtina TaxID=191418 RepID=UPI001E6860A9|nr:uncharacterized protein LOC123867705 [Maniola jurtina]